MNFFFKNVNNVLFKHFFELLQALQLLIITIFKDADLLCQ